MTCSQPPELTDEQISAAIDGAADDAVRDHLARCPACSARLSAAAALERALHAALDRRGCPSPQQLGDYHLGIIDQESDRAIIRHIETCVRCREELEELRAFLAADEAPRPVAPPRPAQPRRAGLGELIARILPRAPQLAVRGAAATGVTAEAGGATIVLDAERAGPSQLTLIGQVLDAEQERWAGALVELRQSGALRATATLDDLGGFRCGPIAAAPVELRITPPRGRAVIVPEVELR